MSKSNVVLLTDETPEKEKHKLGLHKETWTFRFEYQGKRYTLEKRNKSVDGAWYLRCKIHRVPIEASLDTTNADTAKTRAILNHIKPARDGNWDKVKKSNLRLTYSTIGELLAMYHELSKDGRIGERSLRENPDALRKIIRRALGNEGMASAKVDAQSTVILTGKLVADFEEWMRKACSKRKGDHEANKRTVEGYLRQARSIFMPLLMQRYGEKGIKLPDPELNDMKSLKGFIKRAVSESVDSSRPEPSDALLKATYEAGFKLKTDDWPVYIVLLLARHTLRRGEISRMKWSWIEMHNERWWIYIPKKSKSKKHRPVPCDERLHAELEAFKAERIQGLDLEDEQYVIPSPRMGQGGGGRAASEVGLRGQAIFNRANAWMRKLGWTSRHTIHEMRAVGLGDVLEGYDLDKAQTVAGHADRRTTQKHYTGAKKVKDVVITLPDAIWGQTK